MQRELMRLPLMQTTRGALEPEKIAASIEPVVSSASFAQAGLLQLRRAGLGDAHCCGVGSREFVRIRRWRGLSPVERQNGKRQKCENCQECSAPASISCRRSSGAENLSHDTIV
jgi:hypothetical protein